MNKSSIAQKMGRGIINATANILSAPAQIKSARSQSQADSDFKVLKKANQYDKAPNFQNGQPTNAFKVRSMAQDVKNRLMKK